MIMGLKVYLLMMVNGLMSHLGVHGPLNKPTGVFLTSTESPTEFEQFLRNY